MPCKWPLNVGATSGGGNNIITTQNISYSSSFPTGAPRHPSLEISASFPLRGGGWEWQRRDCYDGVTAGNIMELGELTNQKWVTIISSFFPQAVQQHRPITDHLWVSTQVSDFSCPSNIFKGCQSFKALNHMFLPASNLATLGVTNNESRAAHLTTQGGDGNQTQDSLFSLLLSEDIL